VNNEQYEKDLLFEYLTVNKEVFDKIQGTGKGKRCMKKYSSLPTATKAQFMLAHAPEYFTDDYLFQIEDYKIYCRLKIFPRGSNELIYYKDMIYERPKSTI